MNNIAVCTTFPDVMYDIYAKKMLESYAAFWPEDISLLVHLDTDLLVDSVNKVIRSQDGLISGHSKEQIDFITRNKGRDDPNDYRKQACRFSHKVFTLKAASDYWTKHHNPVDGPKCRYLIWLDADVLTTRSVTHEDLVKCLPRSGDAVSYLGRKDWDHSECGWLAFDLENGGATVINSMYEFYTSDEVFKMKQWHDSFIFDLIACNRTDLTSDAKGMEVWPQSPMAPWSRHYKGPIAKDQLALPKKNKQVPLRVETCNSIPDGNIVKNIMGNQAQFTQWVKTCTPNDEEIIVVSAGPMFVAEDILEQYKAGKKIVAVKHALEPLKAAGIKPWACILLDPRDHVADFVKSPDKDIKWFVASQVVPEAVKSLLENGCDVWGYHASVGAGEGEHTERQWDSIVSGGSATATRGLFLLDKLGFRKFKLYGYDLCVPDKPDLNLKDERGQPQYLEISIDTKTPYYAAKRAFWTKGEFVAQFEELKQIISSKSWEISAYGHGLLPFMLEAKRVNDLRQTRKRGKLAPKVHYKELLECKTKTPLLVRLLSRLHKIRLKRSLASNS